MRRILIIAILVFVFLVGLSVLLYPMVSDYYNSLRQIRAVEQYYREVTRLSELDYTTLLEDAHHYNEKLRLKASRFVMTAEELAEYRSLLDPGGQGAIGTLEIESIDINLPIYHGTDESVLQVALGHLEGSSLPVGGSGTHTVITGHRGLPSSTLLTNLDRLSIGDTFNLYVLGDTLTYMVDQTVTVLPHETEALAIESNADYCTLVTCTPYGINTHRLLVRGHRVETVDTGAYTREARISSGGYILTGARSALLLIIPSSLAVITSLFVKLRRVYKRGNKQ